MRKIIVLCGSTRFKKEFEQIAHEETLNGHIVLTVHAFGYFSRDTSKSLTAEETWKLDQLHFDKIRMADEFYVIDPGGYRGLGLCDEIGLAWTLGIPIRSYDQEKGCK